MKNDDERRFVSSFSTVKSLYFSTLGRRNISLLTIKLMISPKKKERETY
jgi:hypothetical protein